MADVDPDLLGQPLSILALHKAQDQSMAGFLHISAASYPIKDSKYQQSIVFVAAF